MVVALAGRRIDPADAPEPQFEPRKVAFVRARLEQLFRANAVHALVSAAANGADLIAIGVASSLRIRTHIVLPFSAGLFRERSVADRPGDWGTLFDAAIGEASARDDLEVLALDPDTQGTFDVANAAILNGATKIGQEMQEAVVAVVVWDGPNTRRHDHTQDFAQRAQQQGLPVMNVPIREERV